MPERSATNRENAAAKQGTAAAGAARRRLAERRKALGLTQEALAHLVGVERTTIVRWERGEFAPLPLIRSKLARVLRVSADRLEELLVPGAPAGPGPSGAEAGSRPRQLPPAVTGFTGRAVELAALTQILAGAGGAAGTVVISAIGGTAGVGKTALAIQWAHQVVERFPDGQLYVNLRGYDPDRPMPAADALAGFLRALGVAGQDIPPEEDQRAAWYRSLISGRRVLVVLDNAGSAEQVRPLLPGSRTCVVVVTSRASLTGLVARDGAARLELDLLPPPDAVRLLRDLMGDPADADPGATEALAELCCRLPLALRVAAERAADRPGMPLASLVGELGGQRERLDMLDAGGDPRTAVRAVFSWSYQHLDPGTARTFRLAGLHPGADFEPYAVAALTDSDLGQAHRTLTALSRAHLVQTTETGRYAMHDLPRAYARELATRDGGEDQDAALTRLFDHYLHTASVAMDTLYPAERHRRPRIPSPATPIPPVTDAAAARAWLDAERATLAVATMRTAGPGWPGHAIRLAATLFRYLDAGGYYPEALTVFRLARAAARSTGDRTAEASALNNLGIIHHRQSRYQEAAGDLRQALALYEQADDRGGQARALNNLGHNRYLQGSYREAAGLHRRALAIYRETGDPVGQTIALVNLGISEERQGRYHLAARHHQQALTITAETGASNIECYALVNLGTVGLRQGRYQHAADQLHRALALSRETGYRDAEAEALGRTGELCLRQGHPDEAVRHLQGALALYRELGDPSGEADTLNSLGDVLLATGYPRDTPAQHDAALALAAQAGDKYQQARAHRGRGDVCRAAGDPAGARRHWQRALALFTELGTPEAGQVREQLAAPQDASPAQKETSRRRRAAATRLSGNPARRTGTNRC